MGGREDSRIEMETNINATLADNATWGNVDLNVLSYFYCSFFILFSSLLTEMVHNHLFFFQ